MSKKKLTLIVHGIGEQQAGETLDQLVGAASGEDAGTVRSDIKWMRDQHAQTDRRKVDLFPCHTRTMRVGEKELVFAEVFWADLSTGSRNWIFVLIELVKTILGLGYVVHENVEEQYPEKFYEKKWIGNAKPPTFWGRSIRRVAHMFVNGLHGPILTSNLTCALALIMVFVALTLHKEEILFFDHLNASLIPIAVIATGALAIGMHFRLKKSEHGYLFSVFIKWLFYYGCGMILLVLAREFLSRMPLGDSNPFLNLPAMKCEDVLHCTFQWYVLVLPMIQGFLWVALIALATSIVLMQWLNKRFADQSGQTLFPYTCMAMIILFMSTAVMIWGVFLRFYQSIFKFDVVPREEGERLSTIALASSTPVWIALFCILVASCWIVMSRARWKRAYYENKQTAGDVPRLIVGDALKHGLSLGLAIMVFGLVVMMPAVSDIYQSGTIDDDFCEIEVDNARTALGYQALCYGPIISTFVASLMALAFPFLVSLLAVGLGVAKDIIGYFSFEPVRNLDGTKSKTETATYLRWRINGRMKQVFDRLIKAEEPDEIVIISHSQGTIVAMEAIENGLLDSLDRPQLKRVSLVTMGSPSYHIYLKYFRNRFNPGRYLLLEDWRAKLGRWVNIYRVDDFVGTHINQRHGNWPVNRAVNPGGHTGYWSDDEVREWLYSSVLTEFMSVTPAE